MAKPPSISFNAKGVPVIAGTRTKVRLIAVDHIVHGWDAQEIHRQYPNLTLGQIHAALAYYYDHKGEMEADIKEGRRFAAELKAQQGSGPISDKLRAKGPSLVSLVFYMNHHVPSGVTEGLRQRGVEVLTAYEDGYSEAEDEDVLQRAAELQRLLYTQDDDFLRIASQWQQARRYFAGIAYAHQEKITVGKAVAELQLIAEITTAEEMENRVQYLPL